MIAIAANHGHLEGELLDALDATSPWAAIFEQAGLAIAILDADFVFLRVNQSYAAAAGKTPDSFLGHTFFALFPQPAVEAIFCQVRASGIAYAHTARAFLPRLSPTLGLGEWNWSLTPFGADGARPTRTRHLVLTMQDVSASVNAEVRARLGESDLRTLLGQLPGMTYRANADWSSDVLLNSESLTGYSAAEINALPEKWRSLIHPDDLAAVLATSDDLREGPRQATVRYRIIDKSGKTRRVEDRKASLFDDNGHFAGVEGIVVDTNGSSVQDELLRQNDLRYRCLIETSLDGYWLTDTEGRLLEVNDAYCRLSGYTRDELRQLSVSQLDAVEDADRVAAHIAAIRDAGRGRFTTAHRRKDGTTWPVEVSSSYSPEAGGRLIVFLRDIEQQRQTEALLATRMRLTDLARNASSEEILQAALDAAEELTGSSSGLIQFVTTDQELASLPTAAPDGDEACLAPPHELLTADAPTMHELSLPVVLDGRCVALVAVGNKRDDYTPEDAETVSQIATLAIQAVARKHAETALRASERRFRGLFDSLTSGFALHEIVLDADGQACDYRFLDVNPAFEAITGLSRDAVVGRCVRSLLPQIEAHWIERYAAVALSGDCAQFDDFSSDLKRHYRVTAYCPEPGQFAVICDDITAARRNEESLRQAATVFEQTRDGVAITDADGTIVAVNRAFTEITGYESEEVVGRNPRLLKSGHHDASFYAAMWSELHKRGFWQGEIINRRRNGSTYPEWLTISAVLDECGRTERYIGVFTDISRIRDAEARAEFVAYHDILTRLPNRTLLNIRYQHALDRAQRHGRKLALLIIDLDLFKNINDSLGHEFGDRLLLAISERFRSRLRDEDTLARLHGDEFALLMEDVEVAADAAVLARDLLRALEPPFRIGNADDIYIGASVGISVSPDDGSDLAALLRNADAAVNLAKQQGRKTLRFYTESLTTQALERMSLEARLRKAMELGQLTLHYQPLIDAHNGAVIGSEALARWFDPEHGMIAPMRFIPVAEDSGLIAPLGAWVLHTACRQMKEWLDAGRPLRSIAVNLSPRQFFLQDVPELVRQTLADTGLDAHFLELEITEGILIERGDEAVAILNRLRELGVRLSIDDFGTGYSSLSYLKRFPIDKLKIDQSFVRDITSNAGAAEIASTIIAMGRSLKLSVLAEGVETAAQRAFLERHGCDYYQGYLFSRPVPAEQFPEACPVSAT